MRCLKTIIVLISILSVYEVMASDSHKKWHKSVGINYVYSRNLGNHNSYYAFMPTYALDFAIIKYFRYNERADKTKHSIHLSTSFLADKFTVPQMGSFKRYGAYVAPYLAIPIYTHISSKRKLSINWYPGLHILHSWYKSNNLPSDYFPSKSTKWMIANGFGLEYASSLKNKDEVCISVAQSIMQLFPKKIEGIFSPFSVNISYRFTGKKELPK